MVQKGMTNLIKTPEQIEKMRVAGRLAAEQLEMIAPYVQKGVTTDELNQLCHNYTVDVQQAIPAPLNYHGYPKSVCISLNEVVCHGIPSHKKLREGDILNIDVTIIKDGVHGDSSAMFIVGNTTPLKRKLCQAAQDALYAAIKLVRPGIRLGDIGAACQQIAEPQGFSVVRDFCGHGIGEGFHEEPQILHYGLPGTGMELQAGMTFTIEPMLNAGTYKCKVNKKDGWTATTRDGQPSAQWEHTLLVTDDGVEVLTLRSDEDFPRKISHS
ncbi:type I methionyl aminopeptidase [Celerinatantimonas yamalensis]|uniref:Methionine aminopeptidase n=1 Tax=Celerinatantimonas yamalensis TaxID=559956 RepID=A0ABW9G8K3_9GAMM